jgi:hypothetical protein
MKYIWSQSVIPQMDLEKFQTIVFEEQPRWKNMSDTSRGLPLTSSRVEQIFPILTPAQLNRIAVHGHMRAIQPAEVLVEQGDSTVPFFVVVSGEIEIVRPLQLQQQSRLL